jgi:SAM-dependent methyltransferase
MTTTDTITSHVATRWNGTEGLFWAREAERFDRMLQPFGDALLHAAGLRHGERVLDVGSGAGATTLAAAWEVTPGGRVTGLDVSTPLVGVARQRAAGLRNVEFVVGDAQTYPFAAGAHDVVISRHGAMLFADPVAAFANLAGSLRAGGRLAFVTWAEASANGWSAIPAAAVAAHLPAAPPPGPSSQPGPCAFSLADPAAIRHLLAESGFTEVGVTRVERPTWVGTDVDDAVAFFESSAGDLRAHLPADTVSRIVATLRTSLAPYEQPDGVGLPAAAWLVTARVS